ncbi:RNase adapter RapZ [Cuneatibacter caecimuris]|uniref:UPF0042 nucleotide-binding protein n=1 Tax=Cuneatibacter caecimuris TaxID=1796618 RepID=A0A4Q7PPP9_9FIRM|nr:RNase adapter RapZ [Cuneatibacter caecimuris]RZT02475.1 UPF0042 nucleotide-binding protein [Cuneatibacter caecimuris]
MRFVVVTGMSGAGKSTALKMLEDMGYYCVDNLPISLILNMAELTFDQDSAITRVALGIDIRNGKALSELEKVLEEMPRRHYDYEILFLDAADACLVKRYKETRRSHPLSGQGRVEDGIFQERRKLEFLREQADYVIDTSKLLTRELRPELEKIFIQGREFQSLFVTVLSFGFKHGIPEDSDLVFDVRFLPNPYYVEELRPLTGNDAAVRNYVMQFDMAKIFRDKLVDMVRFLLPNYVREGKNQLVISIGCTGGRHRSVTLANALYEALSDGEASYGLKLEHRDIDRDVHIKKN